MTFADQALQVNSPKRASLSYARGFSLVEVSLVVLVIGVIAAIAMNGFSRSTGGLSKAQAGARGEAISQAIQAFALQNRRLPCPDVNGNGHEGTAGGACPANTELGWVPYASLSVEAPASNNREVYGVFRGPAGVADLVAPGATAPYSQTQFLNTLINASTIAISNAHIYVTGDQTTAGAGIRLEDCANNIVLHPAYVLIIPNQDINTDGVFFDGVNTGKPAAGNCIASPIRSPDLNYDDVVVFTGFSTLIGLTATAAP